MKLRILIAVLVAIIPGPAYATPTPIGPFVPEQIILEGDQIYLKGAANFPNPDNCANPTMIKIVAASPAETERMYSALLTSVAGGKSITVWTNNCVTAHWGFTVPQGYDLILHR